MPSEFAGRASADNLALISTLIVGCSIRDLAIGRDQSR